MFRLQLGVWDRKVMSSDNVTRQGVVDDDHDMVLGGYQGLRCTHAFAQPLISHCQLCITFEHWWRWGITPPRRRWRSLSSAGKMVPCCARRRSNRGRSSSLDHRLVPTRRLLHRLASQCRTHPRALSFQSGTPHARRQTCQVLEILDAPRSGSQRPR